MFYLHRISLILSLSQGSLQLKEPMKTFYYLQPFLLPWKWRLLNPSLFSVSVGIAFHTQVSWLVRLLLLSQFHLHGFHQNLQYPVALSGKFFSICFETSSWHLVFVASDFFVFIFPNALYLHLSNSFIILFILLS